MFPSKQTDHDKLAESDRCSEHLGSELEKANQSSFGDVDNVYVDLALPPYQNMIKGTQFLSKDYEKYFSFAGRSKNVDEKSHVPICKSETCEPNDKKLSTNERIRLAGEWFVKSYSSKVDEVSKIDHPISVSFSGLSNDETKDIELLLTLLTSAEQTSRRQFDRASNLVEVCRNMSSDKGNPVERLVYYFSKPIREKINRETGKDGLEEMQMFDLQEAVMSVDKSFFSFHQRLPLSRIYQFSDIRTIIENVREARKVHVIDLEIRSGMKYTVMLQALAGERNLERFKITAFGTRAELKIKDTGKRLAEFAESMNIPFSFEIIMVADVLDFNIDLLELNEDEKVAVCAPFFLSTLISKPNYLEHLMRVIRDINPCITVVSEIEANHTTPAFSNRFTEALFFYGALFDSLSYCLDDDDRNRKVLESVFYGQTISNIVAAEGDKRTIRHIGIDVWRSFFARFGMMEMELSDESVFEGTLLISNFGSENSCSIRVDGGCLLIDWKDVPVFSVSAWKFVR